MINYKVKDDRDSDYHTDLHMYVSRKIEGTGIESKIDEIQGCFGRLIECLYSRNILNENDIKDIIYGKYSSAKPPEIYQEDNPY